MAEHETIADLIAWLRKPREGENAYLTLWRDEIADRLEAAHKRERGDCAKLLEVMNRVHDYLGELIRDNLVEDTPRASDLADDVYDAIHGSRSSAEKSSVAGNVAKLREALEELVADIEMRGSTFGLNVMVDTKTYLDAKAALAAKEGGTKWNL